MNHEFHYWMTGIIAHAAGFDEDEAQTIAHASQYVDDNDKHLMVELPEHGGMYEAYISQTMNILKPKQTLMRIYPIFHFIPGAPEAPSARRGDGKMHILTTTPDSERANRIFDAALSDISSHRLHRIAVATHAYADTWAHQNFVGWHDAINGMSLNPLPNIGHADYAHHPDLVAHRWQDRRVLDNAVSNNERFITAAGHIYAKFRSIPDMRPANRPWEALADDLRKAMGAESDDVTNKGEARRIAAYRRLLEMDEYSPTRWFDEAIATQVNGLDDMHTTGPTIFRDSYTFRGNHWQSTDWAHFQDAVKAHQKYCMSDMDALFSQMGIRLGDH